MQIRPLARARGQAHCWWSEARTCRRHSSARRRTPCAAPRSAPPRSRKRERTGRAWQRTARARLERSSVSGDEPRSGWREVGPAMASRAGSARSKDQFTPPVLIPRSQIAGKNASKEGRRGKADATARPRDAPWPTNHALGRGWAPGIGIPTRGGRPDAHIPRFGPSDADSVDHAKRQRRPRVRDSDDWHPGTHAHANFCVRAVTIDARAATIQAYSGRAELSTERTCEAALRRALFVFTPFLDLIASIINGLRQLLDRAGVPA